MNWYQKSSKDIFDELGVDPKVGLSSHEARSRLARYGLNILASKKKETLAAIFLRQVKSPLIYILILASVIAGFLGEAIDALVIFAVILLNAVVGAVQEGRARNSLEKLRSLTRHRALVLRDGREELIASEEVVPGDIVILNEGDKVVFDGRFVVEENLRTDESVLTGEAYTVSKTAGVLKKEGLGLGDQKNMVFSGTSIASGHGIAIAISTGIESELGKISKEILETSDVPLPLAEKIKNLSRFIVIAAVFICFGVLAIGLLRGLDTLELFYAVIGLSVSIIPEGLPVAVTIVLARGVWLMAKNKAIVRQMAAVEAMGNASVLLVDKTGTITTGEMNVREIYLDGEKFAVSGMGYDPDGKISGGDGKSRDKLNELTGLCFLSLKASVVKQENDGWRPIGDPTEAAIAAFCLKAGVSREELEREYKTVYANPFDSDKRYIEAVFEKEGEKRFVYVGAPDYIAKDLKVDHKLLKDTERLTRQGRRVVALAVFGGKREQKRLIGSILIAIDEEMREEVYDAVTSAHKAGFRVVMMTGDYPITAEAIAKKAGIFGEGDRVITGQEVDKLSEENLSKIIDKTTVFARITPSQKLKIVRSYQSLGLVCVMTGDGVNDAPALQAANLGIGLGSGTQVAKDASDIVLTDDNFKTIIGAIAEGRAIYLTLKKVILYLFSTSIGEVLVIAGAVFAGLPLPVVAVQIIWLNFVTDGFFVVALAQDRTRANLISAGEVKSDKLVDGLMMQRMALTGIAMLAAALPVFYFYLASSGLEYARTMSLVVLAVTQWFNAFNVRSRFRSIITIPMNNIFLILSFSAVLILQVLVVESDFGNRVLHTVPLRFNDWILAIAVSTLVVWVEEARKVWVRMRKNN